jgi:hypothetical protein
MYLLMNYIFKIVLQYVFRYVTTIVHRYASVVKFVSSKLNFANNSYNIGLGKLLMPSKDHEEV